jgi:vacuolar-type H+-ATPase subunit E/Vma4
MTVEEKLDNFRTICVENARKDAAKAQNAAKAKLEASFEEHKAQKKESMRTRVYEETIEVRREFNRIESERRAEIRRKMAKRQAVIENRIFESVEAKLAEFRKSPAYAEYLIRKVSEAMSFAEGDSITIYIDPADKNSVTRAFEKRGLSTVVSNESFGGGVRVVLNKRRILIDNSFKKKLEEARERFSFDGGNGVG